MFKQDTFKDLKKWTKEIVGFYFIHTGTSKGVMEILQH